jgi:glutamine synthetase
VGPEQEYFIVDRKKYNARKDLIYTGRTLFGAMPPKGQEMDDHYFGSIPARVGAFMKKVDEELWKMGVTSKTEHNEAAPAQHELAPIYEPCNIAVDHNQLIMETMKRVASDQGLVCLLHEKPFAGVNGSGKHNNWSLTTDDGINLLNPGKTPHANIQFLLVLSCIIKAVDEHADLMRFSAANVGNEHRLGANEAPPAIVSIFLGQQLTDVVSQMVSSGVATSSIQGEKLKTGSHSLSVFTKDATDRNRTSPFAFTGNKFEFRMLGSSNSIACANIMLNAAVAESLMVFADRLEGAEDFEAVLHEMIKETITAHKRIIFNGNGYDDAWIKEATEVRGLLNYRTTADCMPHLLDEKNVDMLTRHKVFSVEELRSRRDIMLENYCKTVTIEANTMISMARTLIAPSVEQFTADMARNASAKKAVDPSIACAYETGVIGKLSALTDRIAARTDDLQSALVSLHDAADVIAESAKIRDEILPKMCELRLACDEAETLTDKDYWPLPTYADILFSVR